MKIYCILLDTCPLYPEISTFAEKINAQLSYQVSNSHTASSILGMFTGQRPSVLMDENNSIHKSWQRNPDDVYSTKFPWNEETITQKLVEKGWKTTFHNSHTIIKDVCSHKEYKRTTAYPGGLKAEGEKWWDHRDIIEASLGNSNITNQYYADEVAHIQKFQQPSENNEFYFVLYHQYHMAEQMGGANNLHNVAASRMMGLLDQWDFDEPDSIFYVFSDHGMYSRINKFQNPPYSWYTWSFTKDNTGLLKGKVSSVSSLMDFCPTILDVLRLEYSFEDSRSLCSPLDKDRVYFIEDSRFSIDDMKTTTAAAIQVLKWEDDKPTSFVQVSYHAPIQAYKTYVYDTKKNNKDNNLCYPYPGSVVEFDGVAEPYLHLKGELNNKYKELFK
jgi:hypothetical protein